MFRPITVSVGVAALVSGVNGLEDLIGAADEEMYRAEREQERDVGRRRVPSENGHGVTTR